MPTDGSRIATDAERRQHQKRLRKRLARLGVRTRAEAVRFIASSDRGRLTNKDVHAYLDVLPQLWQWDQATEDAYFRLLDEVTPGGVDGPLSDLVAVEALPKMYRGIVERVGPRNLPPKLRTAPADARSAHRKLLLYRGFLCGEEDL